MAVATRGRRRPAPLGWCRAYVLAIAGAIATYAVARRRPARLRSSRPPLWSLRRPYSSGTQTWSAASRGSTGKKWAVAVMLSMMPSTKADGWKPRSVGKHSNRTGSCPGGRSLCAALVLGDSVARNGGLGDEADFVVLIDADAPESLVAALAENGARPVRMIFDDFPVFNEYLLLRKLYIFALFEYERVVLLDLDGVVTGSLRFLFESPMTCGQDIAPPTAEGDMRCSAVDHEVCAPAGQPAEIVAQQTSGTPVLTAYAMVRPSPGLWRALGADLTEQCGGEAVCDRKRVNERGWGGVAGPHDWSTRSRSDSSKSSSSSPIYKGGREDASEAAALTWAHMGAGFSDQGFVEYFFALRRRRALLVSKWSCAKRLHYLHFNVPPKPWNCPSNSCRLRTDRDWDSPAETLAWGGHHCARDWWWQYSITRPSLRRPEGSCVAQCAADLDSAMLLRKDGDYLSYTPGPRCAHLWQLKGGGETAAAHSTRDKARRASRRRSAR